MVIEIKVVYEDEFIIVVEKPPGMPSQQDFSGEKPLLAHIQNYLSQPYIALIQRLDRPVGGLMVLGKSEFSGRELSQAVAERRFEKHYLAVTCGEAAESDRRQDYLLKNPRTNTSRPVPRGTSGSKEAVLSYRRLSLRQGDPECSVSAGSKDPLSLVRIELMTGRHHQIRVQFAQAGLPLWGDKKYNPNFVRNPQFTKLALWAGQLRFEHPKTKEWLTFQALPWKDYPFSLFPEAYF